MTSGFRLSLVTVELQEREHLVFAEAVEDPPWEPAVARRDVVRDLTLPNGQRFRFHFLVSPVSEALVLSLRRQASVGSFAFESFSVTCDPLIERPAVIVPSGSVSQRSLSPDHTFTYRLVEQYSSQETVLSAFGASRHFPDIAELITSNCGIDLAASTDRVGNLLTFRRVSPWRLETSAPLDNRHRWVRALDGASLPSRSLPLRTRFLEYGELIDESILQLPPSGAQITLPADATAFELSLFDPTSGALLAADGGGFLPDVSVSISMVEEQTFTIGNSSHKVGWVRPDPPGPTVDQKAPWKTRSKLRGVRAVHAAEARQLRISLGTDRTSIVAMLRDILVKASTHIEIWDPYFCDRDVLEFLPWVAPFVKCRVMCGTRLPNTAQVPACPAVQRLKTALAVVRNLPSSRQLEVRFRVKQAANPMVWNAIYHDRFLVTDLGAWVLGASFNAIGNKTGAIFGLQSPEQLLGMFDDEWNRTVGATEALVQL